MPDLADYTDLADSTQALHRDLTRALESSGNETVRGLAEDLPTALVDDEAPVTITFVGAYNAGKSTLIKALTGRDDVATGSDVTTQEATGYDWRGLRLIDTPGVSARRPDHDAATQLAVDRADLLAFVVSDELFSDTLAPYFRSLAVEQGRGHEMMLVVNKMAQTGGRPEDKAKDIEPVTHPYTVEDLRAVFTDAESAVRARDEDRPERSEALRRRSNIDALEARLAAFARDQGWLGRLDHPARDAIRRVAADAQAVIGADLPEEQMALQLLRLQRRLLRGSQARLERTLGGLLDAARADLATIGDRLAEALRPDANEADLQREAERAEREAKSRCEKLAEDADAAVQSELMRLEAEMQELKESPIATRLLEAGERVGDGTVDVVHVAAPESDISVKKVSPRIARVRKASKVASELGEWAFKFASGPNAKTLGWTTKAASGSKAHKTVLAVGRFFGHKFKPWGAVKVAKGIGTAGRVLGVVGGALAVFAQIAEDRQIEAAERQLRTSRDDIRAGYRDAAAGVAEAFQESIADLNRTIYAPPLERIDTQTAELVQVETVRSEEADEFSRIIRVANDLIRRTHVLLPEPIVL